MPKLLVATDFSPGSDRALRRASLIAKSAGYRLFVANIVDSDQPRRKVDADVFKAEAQIAKICAMVENVDGLECEWRVRVGGTDESLVALAGEIQAEVIVVGPHRQRPLLDPFVGTMLERLIRGSHLPVLVANGVPSADYDLVLLPTDLRPASRHAAQVASALSFLRESEFCFIHLYELVGSEMASRAMASGAADDDDEHDGEEADQARADLDSFVSSTGLTTPHRSEICAMDGLLTQDLVEAADKRRADLIALAPSNKSTVQRLMLGSVTKGLLRAFDRDLLVIPAQGEPLNQ